MKKSLLIAAIAVACAIATPRVSAQSAMFTYTGVPAGPVMPGSSFTIGINIVVATGGTVGNIQGLSYWFAQSSPAGGPYPFAITGRDITGSLFTVINPLLVLPQPLAPFTMGDLGQGVPGAGLPSGTYFLANLTFSVAPGSAPGSYTLGNTTISTPMVGGRISVFNDSVGDTAPIAASNFNITVVPEPGSFALIVVGAVGAGLAIYGRRRALVGR